MHVLLVWAAIEIIAGWNGQSMEGIRKGDRGRSKDLSEVFNHVWVDCAWGRELGFVLELGPRSTFQNLVFDNKFLTIFQFTIIFRCITAINSCVDAPAEKQCSSTGEMQSDSIFPRLRRCLPGHFSS